MKKIIYIEEKGKIYSETFVSSEKIKLEEMGYTIENIHLNDINICITKLFRIVSLKALIIGFLLSIRSMPNIRRFVSNVHASLLVAVNINSIKQKCDECYEIRAHFLAKRATAAYIISKIVKKDYTVVAHAADIFDWDNSLIIKIKNAKRIDAISNYNVGFINSKMNFDCSDKIELIRNSFIKPKLINKESSSCHNFLMITRLVEKKGVYESLELFYNFYLKHKNSVLHIAGDGPLLTSLMDKVKRLGIQEVVIFHGVINKEEVSILLSSADFLLLLCRRGSFKHKDMDGLPTVFFESNYLGKPVITNSVSGIPELIHDGFNGIFVDNKETSVVINDIEKMLNTCNDEKIKDYFSIFASFDVSRFYLS